MKVDPYKHKERYDKWKEEGAPIPDVSKINEKLIRQYIFDMEKGINVGIANKKGARSHIRLNAYRHKLKLLAKLCEKKFKKNFPQLSKQNIHDLFMDMREGKIKRQDKKPYTHVADYIKSFKAFWHWYQRVSKKKIIDITEELDTKIDKPKWVFLDEKQVRKLAEYSMPYYKLLIYFLLDTGLRATELKNVRINWIHKEKSGVFLHVPEEVSKTIGRNIKLMICSELLLNYIDERRLKGDDIIFNITLPRMNQQLKRTAKRLFGEGKSKAGKPFNQLTILDLRHISACYWVGRYPKQQGMMYRFGWKKADKIFYYSEFMGMVDNIQQEDLLIDVTKTELQQANEKLQRDLELFKDSTLKEMESTKKEMEKLRKIIHAMKGS